MSYNFSKTVNYDFDTAIAWVTEEITKECFGELTEIDEKGTLKKNLKLILKNTVFRMPVIHISRMRQY